MEQTAPFFPFRDINGVAKERDCPAALAMACCRDDLFGLRANAGKREDSTEATRKMYGEPGFEIVSLWRRRGIKNKVNDSRIGKQQAEAGRFALQEDCSASYNVSQSH